MHAGAFSSLVCEPMLVSSFTVQHAHKPGYDSHVMSRLCFDRSCCLKVCTWHMCQAAGNKDRTSPELFVVHHTRGLDPKAGSGLDLLL
jgi:hypothetical protein